MLAGLMSRCTRPSEWASYSDAQICRRMLDHAALGLRTVLFDQRLQVDAVEILHRVIEHALGRAAVVVDRHRVRIVELAGDLHFALEPLDRGFVDAVDVEHLDRRGPAQHGVLSLVDDAHRAGADLFLQPILPELLGLDRGLLGLALQAGDDQREDEDRHRADAQQGIQHIERPLQNRQRAIGLGGVDLGDDAPSDTRAATSRHRPMGTPR